MMMVSEKVVTPAKTGVRVFHNDSIILDPGFRRE